MLALRPAALLLVTLACTRAEPEPSRPPPAVEHDPIPAKPLRPVEVPVGQGALAGLEPGDPESRCRGSHQRARCMQARANPDVTLSWRLSWDTRGLDGDGVVSSQDDPLARRQRVVERLLADGASQVFTSDPASVSVVAPYRVVRGAMAMPGVQDVEVDCADDDREFCACERLRVDQCPQHAFCNDVFGQRRDPKGACLRPPALAGCTRAGMCRDMSTNVIDPMGRMWWFHNSCKPDQPGWRHVQQRLDPLPDCRRE